MRRFILLLSFITCIGIIRAQVVYEHVNNESIYLFLDELESNGIIRINSISKPYARKFIYEKLKEAQSQAAHLTPRQQKEVEFYLKNFGFGRSTENQDSTNTPLIDGNGPFSISTQPPSFAFQNQFIVARAIPIAGYKYVLNSNRNFYEKHVGVGANIEIGKNFAAYFTLLDNTTNEYVIDPNFLHQKRGAPVKAFGNTYNYSDIHGGVVFNWEWGNLGLIKDHVVWGPNYNGSNIISSSTNPSIPMLKFDIYPARWLEFHYFHGWLNSNVIENIYTDENAVPREYVHPRYIAANLIELKPWKHTIISFGNSVIYGSSDVHVGYLNPVLFYRPVDYQTSSFSDFAGTNGQMYLSISTRAIKHFHVYSSIFIDELSVSEMFSKTDNHNQISTKVGINTQGLLPNFGLTIEYTRNQPWVYNHFQKITRFETNDFNLGHYLRENAHNFYADITYAPLPRLHLKSYFDFSQKGPEAEMGIYSGLSFLEKINWEQQVYGLHISYQLLNTTFIYSNMEVNNTSGEQAYLDKYSPKVQQGRNTFLTFGFKIGY